MKEEIKGITYFEEDREPTPDSPNNIISIGVDERVVNYIDRLDRKLEEKNKEIERLNNIINKAIEYITSYESIDIIQQNKHLENNKDLDEKTMIEMVRRYMIIHDKLLEILDKGV